MTRSKTVETAEEEPVAPPLTGLSLVKEETTEVHTGVKVYVVPEGEDSLRVEPDTVHLLNGDTVEWIFKGIADVASWLPRVEFFSVPEGSLQLNRHLGPFTSLTVEEDRVIGAGNNGVVGSFGYTVQAIDTATGQPFRSKIRDPGMANDGEPAGGIGG
jgi:plastocyanin